APAAANDVALSNAIYTAVGGDQTNRSVSYTIFIPKGVWYFTNQPRNFTTNENACFVIWHKKVDNSTYYSSLRFKGDWGAQWGGGTQTRSPTATNGTTIWITSTNVVGSWMESEWCMGITNGANAFNNVHPVFEDLQFKSYTNCSLGILNMKG